MKITIEVEDKELTIKVLQLLAGNEVKTTKGRKRKQEAEETTVKANEEANPIPVEVAKTVEETPKEEVKQVEETPKEEITFDELKKTIMEINRKKPVAKALMETFHINCLSDLDPADYGKVIAKAKEL